MSTRFLSYFKHKQQAFGSRGASDYTDSIPTVRFLDLIKPFMPILPEVAAPERKTPFRQRLMWTGVSFPSRYLISFVCDSSKVASYVWRTGADVCDAQIVNTPHLLSHEPNAVSLLAPTLAIPIRWFADKRADCMGLCLRILQILFTGSE